MEVPALRRAVGADQLADPDGLLLPVQWLPPQLGHTFLPRMWKGMPSGVPFSDQGFVNPLRPTEWQWSRLQFGNEKVPNGAFSVPMKDLLTRFELSFQSRELAPEDIPVLRLIMNLIPCNALFKTIGGDIETLGGAPLWLRVIVVSGKVVLFAGEDIRACFYIFRLPSQWRRWMAFSKRVAWSSISPGCRRTGRTYIAAAVIPMGCASAVAVMQHIHRQLATRPIPRGAGLLTALEIRKMLFTQPIKARGPGGVYMLTTQTS